MRIPSTPMLALLLTGCAAADVPPKAAEPEVATVRDSDKREVAITSLPPVQIVLPSASPAAGPPPRSWTCAAFCVTKYNCKSSGDSSSSSRTVSSEGPTAAAAFVALVEKCSGAHSDLVVHGDCRSGSWFAEGASISTSCAAT